MERIVKYQRKEGTTQNTLDSREVAQMLDRTHTDVMRMINGDSTHVGILPTLENANLAVSEYFIEITYKAEGNNKSYPCYLVTKMGCEMLGNKQQGEKGILFTAKYVKRFNEMEETLRSGQVALEGVNKLSPQLQLLINMELEQKQLREDIKTVKEETEKAKEEVQAIRETIIVDHKEKWRTETNSTIGKICKARNDYKTPKDEIYKALEDRARCNLKQRLENLKSRALLNGTSKSTVDKFNNLDVIAQDVRLKEIYISIVKEMAIKNKVA